MDAKKSYYAVIPATVRYDKKIIPGAKLLYGEITALCNEKGFCWATNKYFSDLYEVDSRTIRRWVQSLIAQSYIRVEITNEIDRKIFILEVGQKSPPPRTKMSGGVGQKSPHNNTVNSKNNNTAEQSSAPHDKNDKMSCKQFVEWCRKSNQNHIKIIGEWADGEQPKHETYGQWQSFIKRNLRVAKRLDPYPIEKIEKAYQRMQDDLAKKDPTGKRVGFITKYGLETVEKYIDLV